MLQARERDRIYDFAYLQDWQQKLDELEEMAIIEQWSFKNPRPDLKNIKNPILHNYITHTLSRLEYERKTATSQEEKNKKIYIVDNQIACFNTGLFTKNYRYIYAYFEKNPIPNQQPWILRAFLPQHSLRNVYPFPARAKYFNDISDLIYDTDVELVPNLDHILDDEENKNRIPERIREAGNRSMIFDGAIELAKKKIEANYKTAIPQYFRGKIQFLIPLCLDIENPENVDLALAVEKMDVNGHKFYRGNTCITLEMSYNNARLLAKIDSDWLRV